MELKRLEYPVEETVRVIQESPLPEEARETLAAVFRTGEVPSRLAGDNGKG